MLSDVFGFAECQEKATHGFVYKLALKRNKDEAVLHKAAGIADARIENDHIHWYVPQYTASIQQQDFLSKQMLSKTSTELRYNELSVFVKEVINQNL